MVEDGQPVPGSLFVYAPNRIAPICFAIAYGISAIFHIWQCIHYKAFRLIGLHPLCAVLFTAGYALREVSAYNYIYEGKGSSSLIIYILSQVFIFVCPPLLELANYHVLGRTFAYIPAAAPIPASRVLALFGGLMMAVEALNAVGVAISSNPSSDNQSLGSNLTIAALALQFFVILTFAVLAGFFLFRIVRAGIRGGGGGGAGGKGVRGVKTMIAVLYVSMALILVRCVYRLVEHLGDTSVNLSDLESLKNLTPILRYEWYFYVFEASLMLVNSALWNIWHPGRYLPRNARTHLLGDGTEVVDQGHGDGEHGEGGGFWGGVLAVLTFGVSSHFVKQKGGNTRSGRSKDGGVAEMGRQGVPRREPVERRGLAGWEVVLALLTFGLSTIFLKRESDKRGSEAYEELNSYPRDSS